MLGSLLKSWWSAGAAQSGPRRVHLGCGTDIRPGWINVDRQKLPGVDVVADLDACARRRLPFPDDSVAEFLASHVLEHLRDPLSLMQELHRIAQPGAIAVFRVPYGSSDDADEDPTHVRRFFLHSFYYFCQLGYTHADYGYRGDWDVKSLVLSVDSARHAGKSYEQLSEEVRTQRNVVHDMTATLTAVKPARKPGSAKPAEMRVEFRQVTLG